MFRGTGGFTSSDIHDDDTHGVFERLFDCCGVIIVFIHVSRFWSPEFRNLNSGPVFGRIDRDEHGPFQHLGLAAAALCIP